MITIGKRPPDQREYDQHQRSEGRKRADLGAAESKVVAVQIEIGQVDAQNGEIDKILQTDNS